MSDDDNASLAEDALANFLRRSKCYVTDVLIRWLWSKGVFDRRDYVEESPVNITYHGCGTRIGAYGIGVYVHKGIVGIRTQDTVDITGHAEEECEHHRETEGTVKKGGNPHTERDDHRCILDFLSCTLISTKIYS